MTKSGISGLGLLEDKINKAADLIEQLRQEKNSSLDKNKELKEVLLAKKLSETFSVLINQPEK